MEVPGSTLSVPKGVRYRMTLSLCKLGVPKRGLLEIKKSLQNSSVGGEAKSSTDD